MDRKNTRVPWFSTLHVRDARNQSSGTKFVVATLTHRGVLVTSNLPDTGLLRLWQIIGCKRRKVEPIIPISRTSWFNGCSSGKFPAPIKLGERTTVWRVEDIRRLIENGTPTDSA